MIPRPVRAVCAALAVILLAVNAPISITGQLLAYQQGYVFFTTGDGFRVAPTVRILDDRTKQPAKEAPAPRIYARATFDASGTVVELDLSHRPLPVEPLPADVQQFAVVASTPFPNPELIPKASDNAAPSGMDVGVSGKIVLVTITVQVPPSTPFGSQIFITTDASGWNPQAIAMDRIDALHFRITRHIASGTILHYLYTRGSLQTEERAENGLDRKPRLLRVSDADVRLVDDVVYAWADQSGGTQLPQPNTLPTPYNPAPFPNLPPGLPTPNPR